MKWIRGCFALASLLLVLALAGEVFATAPTTPNLLIVDNEIRDNGFGVYVGWNGSWNVVVLDNLIVSNGEGIRIVNERAVVEGNRILGNVTGIRVTETHEGQNVTRVDYVLIRGNSIEGSLLYGLENLSTVLVRASGNWWGSSSGPICISDGSEMLSPGQGDDTVGEARNGPPPDTGRDLAPMNYPLPALHTLGLEMDPDVAMGAGDLSLAQLTMCIGLAPSAATPLSFAWESDTLTTGFDVDLGTLLQAPAADFSETLAACVLLANATIDEDVVAGDPDPSEEERERVLGSARIDDWLDQEPESDS